MHVGGGGSFDQIAVIEQIIVQHIPQIAVMLRVVAGEQDHCRMHQVEHVVVALNLQIALHAQVNDAVHGVVLVEEDALVAAFAQCLG